MLVIPSLESSRKLLPRIHRFRATDEAGLLALAKDLARVIADSLDVAAMQKIAPPPKKKTWRSLKSLQGLLALSIGADQARGLLTPLGAYELRHADAHLPSSDHETSFEMLPVDRNAPLVTQGRQMLDACVGSLYEIIKVLQKRQ